LILLALGVGETSRGQHPESSQREETGQMEQVLCPYYPCFGRRGEGHWGGQRGLEGSIGKKEELKEGSWRRGRDTEHKVQQGRKEDPTPSVTRGPGYSSKWLKFSGSPHPGLVEGPVSSPHPRSPGPPSPTLVSQWQYCPAAWPKASCPAQ
jgi:hypothetical protein